MKNENKNGVSISEAVNQRNCMREIRSYGFVGEQGGNEPLYLENIEETAKF